MAPMAPREHLNWFRDNVSWFEDLSVDDLDVAVPNCPGWTVADVLNHLSRGVGLSYPVALTTPPNTPTNEVFADVEWPSENPTGAAVLSIFSTQMHQCAMIFEASNPEAPCWTYAGRGKGKFWIRRAAIETALHRVDVAEALCTTPPPVLEKERAYDAIEETLEFALPLALELTDEPKGRLIVLSHDLDIEAEFGEGSRHATIEGEGHDILAALWGRNRDRVNVSGHQDVATAWLSRIELAFAGR